MPPGRWRPHAGRPRRRQGAQKRRGRRLEFKARNKLAGRTYVYDVRIVAATKVEFKTRVVDTINAREALIKDRVRTIIARNDPEKLGGGSEPGLDTLRRQVKHQLDGIIGEG